jgi:hypothetical protein
MLLFSCGFEYSARDGDLPVDGLDWGTRQLQSRLVNVALLALLFVQVCPVGLSNCLAAPLAGRFSFRWRETRLASEAAKRLSPNGLCQLKAYLRADPGGVYAARTR